MAAVPRFRVPPASTVSSLAPIALPTEYKQPIGVVVPAGRVVSQPVGKKKYPQRKVAMFDHRDFGGYVDHFERYAGHANRLMHGVGALYKTYRDYKDYRGRAKAVEDQARFMSIEGPKRAPKGGKVTRRYYLDVNITNLAAATTTIGYGLSIRNAAGPTYSLGLYSGTPIFGTGTLISGFQDFPVEVAHFADVFKWMTMTRVQVEFIPVVKTVNADNTSVTDQSAQADSGLIRIIKWNGDTTIFSAATGAGAYDVLNFSRLKHETFEPVGNRTKMVCVEPNSVVDEPDTLGQDRVTYPKSRSIDTAQYMAAVSEYPHYGIGFHWEHANLSANGGKYQFIMRWTVEVQWNTIKDDTVSTMQKQRQRELYFQARDSVGKPMPNQIPGSDTPILYPEVPIDETFEAEYQEYLRHKQENQQKPILKEDYVDVAKPKVMSRPQTPRK